MDDEKSYVKVKMPIEGASPLLSIVYNRDVVESDDCYYVMLHDLSHKNVYDQLRTPKQIGEILAIAARSCADVLSAEKGNVNLSDQMLAEISDVFQKELIDEEYDKQ